MSGECMPSYNWPTRFNSMYDCLQFGYDEASKKLKEIGPEEVNKYGTIIKFFCYQTEEEIILPKPKPGTQT